MTYFINGTPTSKSNWFYRQFVYHTLYGHSTYLMNSQGFNLIELPLPYPTNWMVHLREKYGPLPSKLVKELRP